MEAVGQDRHAVFRLDDFHGRATAQEIRHHALVSRIKVRDEDKPAPAVRRHVSEELLERFESAGRSTHTDDVGRPDFRVCASGV
jgi:hypothetical protein